MKARYLDADFEPQDGEVFKDVVGYEDLYLVSNMGRVMSTKARWPKFIGSTSSKGGYVSVGLRKDGKTRMCQVHRLILEAFVGPAPHYEGERAYAVCRHLDGNKTNNTLTNLAWGTDAENAEDRQSHQAQKLEDMERLAQERHNEA